MQKKQFRILTLLTFIFISFLQAQKPGFYVQGRFLYDRCGEKVILRGVNEQSVFIWNDLVGASYLPEIRKTGANVVRLLWNTTLGTPTDLDGLIQNCINNKMIPMIELHDATADDKHPHWDMLPQLVDYWVRPDIVRIIQKHEQYLLVNIGNEVGETGIDDLVFINGYKSAIKRMRDAGIRTPLVIDAAEGGRSLEKLNIVANPILNSDLDKNIIFSVHTYWSKFDGATDAFITQQLQAAVNMGYCLIVGEFSKFGGYAGSEVVNGETVAVSGCTPNGEIDYPVILRECQKHEIGWLYWSWGRASNIGGNPPQPLCSIMDMTVGGSFTNLQPGFATDIALTSPFSIKNTAITPQSILSGASCPPPTPTGNCADFITDLMAHGKRGGKVSYQMVAFGTNSTGNGWAQYAEGVLSYSNITDVDRFGAEHLTGDGLQYFSDRTERCRTPSDLKWFAKSRADKMKLSLSMGSFVSGNACNTPVTITLVTWGNAKYTFCPSCYGKNMYLLDNGMLITFKKL